MDINVRSKMGCVRAKIGLTGQLDRRQLENYFKPCKGGSYNKKSSITFFEGKTT